MFPNDTMMKPQTWNDILGDDDRRPRRARLAGIRRDVNRRDTEIVEAKICMRWIAMERSER